MQETSTAVIKTPLGVAGDFKVRFVVGSSLVLGLIQTEVFFCVSVGLVCEQAVSESMLSFCNIINHKCSLSRMSRKKLVESIPLSVYWMLTSHGFLCGLLC